MQSFTFLTVAVAALLHGASAVPAPEVTSMPGHYVCTSITTVTTTHTPPYHCDIACLTPTSVCSPGEPSEKPYPRTTTTPLPGCTVSVIANRPACECPTCHVPQPTA